MSGLPTKNVLLVGYGAVGAIYSLILTRSGCARVTAVARGNFDAVQRSGMHIKSRKYGDIHAWRPTRLCRSVADAIDEQYDYVVVCTKALPEVLPTSKLLAPLLSKVSYEHPQPAYVLLQNGLGVERDLYEAAKDASNSEGAKPRIISTAVWIGTNLISENEVEHNDFDRVTIGVYKPSDDLSDTSMPPEDARLLEDFGGMLRAGGTEVTIVPEIQSIKFRKNFWNLAFSSIATLTRHPLPAVFRDRSIDERVTPAIRGILLETLAVGRALGFSPSALPDSIVEDTIEPTRRIHARADSTHKASMLLDLENGRPLEVEVIVGEVVRNARRLGVDIPRIETLYALLTILQGQLLANVNDRR
ncbi:6-phosphogluconate dehydrogenase C-terminal domain-like protein [Rickenella mellea]|uniref:6-phosphogluconate dehydrogenase C-terminal domain-like protein n=1 Tax=Rickenella mellea TaxID=50990 RepID=A0A4Y7PYP8_9AGAM|nr:6-phosphogluconate dehydrogenase C-terminal domain-like protein [Rickenella mellea]